MGFLKNPHLLTDRNLICLSLQTLKVSSWLPWFNITIAVTMYGTAAIVSSQGVLNRASKYGRRPQPSTAKHFGHSQVLHKGSENSFPLVEDVHTCIHTLTQTSQGNLKCD